MKLQPRVKAWASRLAREQLELFELLDNLFLDQEK